MIRLVLILLTLPALGLGLKLAQPAGAEFDRAEAIALATRMLSANGLEQDHSARIEISGHPAAVVFTPDGCTGAIVLVPLPPTAQRFETVVAGLDQSVSAEGYVLQGESLDHYPRLRVIARRIGHALYLPGSARGAWSDTVFAFRELGRCGLTPDLDWTLANPEKEIT